MNPLEYQIKSRRTETDQYKSLKRIEEEDVKGVRLLHAALGLAGDAGEVCSAVEKYIYYKQELDRLNLIEEIGDCLWYIAQACDALGVDMGNVMATNLVKLKSRYPEQFNQNQSQESSRNRQKEREAMQNSQEGTD